MKFLRKDANILKKYKYILKGLDCANCARKIEERLQKENCFKNVSVNFSTLKLSFEAEEDLYDFISKIISEVEPEVEVLKENISKNEKNNEPIIRLILGILFAGIGFYSNIKGKEIFVLLAYIILLYRTFLNAIKLIIKSKTINENFLITISCIGAYLVGEHMEGLMVILLYEIGKILEEKAIHNSRKSISNLMNIKPEYATLENGEVVLPETVKIGTIILVKKGEKIPLDGVVVSGKSYIDTSSLTGESDLVFVEEGSSILSGSINQEGILKIKVEKTYENSTVSRILELVENATDKKTKTETFVGRASKIYTPIVLLLAFFVAIFLPILTDVTYQVSIYRALIFLVISCPCAIAISVPLSYFSGIGKASKEGILIKGSDYLDTIRNIKKIVFDKTGTLTTGNFKVSKINLYDKNYSKDEVLEYAAYGESLSNHPIAKSIVASFDKKIDPKKIEKHQEFSGKGISYEMDGKTILVGNRNFVKANETSEIGTTIYVSIDDKLIGSIILMDEIKEKTKEAIQTLKKRKIEIEMFTGDHKNSALYIGKQLGISEVKSEMLPDDKYHELEKILKSTNDKVAFVGDGINDSPVLALASVGISMGGIGSSAAIEASDVVIMTDDISKIESAIQISKITDRIIKQNLTFALATKIIILLLSVFGIGGMWQAIFADVGVTLLTILNTLRILKYRIGK